MMTLSGKIHEDGSLENRKKQSKYKVWERGNKAKSKDSLLLKIKNKEQ